jgi:hypothetical protein
MLEAPEVEPHLHHKTGHGLADKILAVLAVFLSCVSVFIAVSHGRTMERLVAANSWPNVGFSTGNVSDNGDQDIITLRLRNSGVGPARIDTLELFYKGVPQASVRAFMESCCDIKKAHLNVSAVVDDVLPARESVDFLSVERAKNDVALWEKLNTERLQVRVRTCYCSVFDECWVADSEQHRPVRVDECTPSQPVQFSASLF